MVEQLVNKKKTKNIYGLRRLQSGLLVLFTFGVLLILNLSAWWIYIKVERYLDEFFSRSLGESARLTASALSRFPQVDEPAESKSSRKYMELQTDLLKLQEAGNFTDLFILDSFFRNLAGVYPDFEIGKYDDLLVTLDRPLLEVARSGKTALTEGEEVGGYFLKTAYTPLTTLSGRVIAILGVKADVEYHRPKLAIRAALIAVTALSGLAILVLAIAYGGTQRALRRSEEKIVHNERMASMGQLAAGIAHELRNPLGIMEQTMTVLRRRYEKQPDEVFDYIPSEISRMNRIITEFLDLAKESPLQLQTANLSSVLDRTLSLLEFRLKAQQIKILKDYPERIEAFFDPEKMQQVFLNLLMNALDAMPLGGPLKVSYLREATSSRHCVMIEDCGEGIKKENLQKIFYPFYTTKENGTGLGLSVAQQIVQQHGGRLEIESVEGKGTVVKVFLEDKKPS